MNGHVYVTEHGQDLNQYAKVNKYHPKKFMKVDLQTDPFTSNYSFWHVNLYKTDNLLIVIGLDSKERCLFR